VSNLFPLKMKIHPIWCEFNRWDCSTELSPRQIESLREFIEVENSRHLYNWVCWDFELQGVGIGKETNIKELRLFGNYLNSSETIQSNCGILGIEENYEIFVISFGFFSPSKNLLSHYKNSAHQIKNSKIIIN